MKHKAQESLDTFKKCMRNVTNYTFNEKVKCDFKTRDTETMQQLIDYQLTVDELEALLYLLNLGWDDEKFYSEQMDKVFKKLNKQKEMWEEE